MSEQKLLSEALHLLGEKSTLSESSDSYRAIERISASIEKLMKTDFDKAIAKGKSDLKFLYDPETSIGLNYNLEELEAILANAQAKVKKAYKDLGI